jgi:hypothetical protein
MRSQVQVLAGPPLFSQLRGLRRLGRWRSLPSWAAPGPRALRTVEPGTSRSGRPGPRSITTGTDRGRHRCSLGHGHLMSASMALTTCGAMAQMGMHSARTLFLDRRRSWRATGVSLAGQVVELGPLPERLPQRRPGPARCRRWPSTARAGSDAPARARAAARAVRGCSRAARLRPSWPCGRLPRRRAPRSHRCGHRGHRRGTPDVHTRTSDTRTLDTGRVDIARADTGRSHPTPDTWTLTEDADRVTKTRQACGQLGPRTSRRPAGRRTVFLWGQRMRRAATITARR